LATSGETVAFAGHSEIVRGLDLATGQLAWSFGPSYWMQFPAVADGQFFLGTGDERFHALESTTGKQLWEQSIDLDSLNQIGRPLLQDDLILFNAVTGDIYGLRQTDGVQVLHLETGITARVGGALYENLYIMGDAEGVLYAYAIR
jgi:outer membrane protein assembly factor BamB